MGALTVLRKDLREHWLAFFALAAGLIGVVMLALAQQRQGEFSLSSFEVVRFAMITIVPLIVLITGNRLVVREYTGGTRKFVESLPLTPSIPLIVKYLLGLIYLILLGVIVILIAALLAGPAEFIDRQYLTLLALKTSTVITLYWSATFFISLTGKLRLVLYLMLSLSVMYLVNLPSFDETGLPPIALMDRQLFVFERESIPWSDIIGTVAIAVAFVIAAFVLALINEGSVAEQLGKPLSRRNIAAIFILGMGVLGVYSNLQDQRDPVSQVFVGESVLRSDTHDIEISYLSKSHRPQAEIAMGNLQTMLEQFQRDTGLAMLPPVQVSLNTDIERLDVFPEFAAGVLVTANYSDYNYYEHSMLSTITLHHMMLKLSNNRWDYETMHWLLDGLSRWWAEGGANAANSPNNPEHYAKALLATQRLANNIHPLLPWQRLMDQYGFEAPGALAYTALLYLAEAKGVDTVIALAMDYLEQKPGSSSVESVKRIFNPDPERFERVTGIAFGPFVDQWLGWLKQKAELPEVNVLLNSVPLIDGEIHSLVDEAGVYWLHATYTQREGFNQNFKGACVLRHQRTSAFDIETDIYERERDYSDCATSGIAHRVQSPYASGDRAYVVLEFETEHFNRPVSLWRGRVHIK